jgi:Flp pilus assembly pilin Flp
MFDAMRDLFTPLAMFLRDDRGEDLAEYGLLASLIAIAVMVAVGDVGVEIGEIWTSIIDNIEGLL